MQNVTINGLVMLQQTELEIFAVPELHLTTLPF